MFVQNRGMSLCVRVVRVGGEGELPSYYILRSLGYHTGSSAKHTSSSLLLAAPLVNIIVILFHRPEEIEKARLASVSGFALSSAIDLIDARACQPGNDSADHGGVFGNCLKIIQLNIKLSKTCNKILQTLFLLILIFNNIL